MPLTPEQITALLKADSDKPKSGRKTKSGIDDSVRDHATWFKLQHKLWDNHDPANPKAKCSNPNCPDPDRMVAEVNGVDMCRICFLNEYMLNPIEQMGLDSE